MGLLIDNPTEAATCAGLSGALTLTTPTGAKHLRRLIRTLGKEAWCSSPLHASSTSLALSSKAPPRYGGLLIRERRDYWPTRNCEDHSILPLLPVMLRHRCTWHCPACIEREIAFACLVEQHLQLRMVLHAKPLCTGVYLFSLYVASEGPVAGIHCFY